MYWHNEKEEVRCPNYPKCDGFTIERGLGLLDVIDIWYGRIWMIIVIIAVVGVVFNSVWDLSIPEGVLALVGVPLLFIDVGFYLKHRFSGKRIAGTKHEHQTASDMEVRTH